MVRSRECDDPAPLFGGNKCEGDITEVKQCGQTECVGKTPFFETVDTLEAQVDPSCQTYGDLFYVK